MVWAKSGQGWIGASARDKAVEVERIRFMVFLSSLAAQGSAGGPKPGLSADGVRLRSLVAVMRYQHVDMSRHPPKRAETD
jgi:hypothetical protein